jgi:SAM-dependent methyltransferase
MTAVDFFEGVYAGPNLYHPHRSGMLVEYVLNTGLRGTALDVGCGDGRNTLWLLDHGFRVIAIDSSETGIAKLTRIASRGATSPGLTACVEDVLATGTFGSQCMTSAVVPVRTASWGMAQH